MFAHAAFEREVRALVDAINPKWALTMWPCPTRDCRPRSVQLRRLRGAAYLPVLKRFEDGSVRFRYMTLHKFRYYSIALRDRFRPPVPL